MNYRKLGSQVILLALLLLSFAFSLRPVNQAHAAGDLSIQQGIPLIDPGTTITIDISVSGMDYFNGWDIAIWTNTTALNATAIDISTSDVFGSGYQLLPGTSCINNAGSHCGTDDGPGIAHLAAVVFPPPPTTSAPFAGVLFSIKYKAGAYTYSPLQFKLSRIINGGCTPCPDIVHTTEDGSYGTTSAPNISLTISDQFPSVTQGDSVNTTVTVSSINDFTGQVSLSCQSNFQAEGIQVTFNTTSLFLNNSTASANITLSASPTTTATQYSLNITATGPRVFQDRTIQLGVQEPGDFKVSIDPPLIRVLPNSTSTVYVTVKSQPRREISQEFAGNVTLLVFAKNATATLGQTALYVGQGHSVSTTLTIWVPESFYGFTYLINVTGIWALNHDVNDTLGQITVTHLPSDLIANVSPSTLTVTSGHSAYGVLSVTSTNYFVGYVYPSSTLSGGTARFNETTVRVDIGQTVYISVNVTMDPATPPGYHTVVLLTATGQLASGVAFARTAVEDIIVRSNGHLVVQLPTKILGLPVLAYWGILAGFAVVFVLLSALFYRRSRADKDEWD